MNDEIEVLCLRIPKKDVFSEDGALTVFGALLVIVLTASVFKWMCDHPDKVKEIVYGKRQVRVR